MKKKLLFLFLFLISSLMCSCSGKSYFVALGDFDNELTSTISITINKSGNDFFSHPKMQSGELFKIVDSNASYYSNGKKHAFFSIAEKSSMFILNLGLNDFLPSMQIDVSKNILEYDSDLVEKQLEVYEYHLFHILDEIRSINSRAPIILLSSYNIYKFESPERKLFNTLVHKINDIMIDLTDFNNTHYVSLLDVETLIYENLDDKINQQIADIIKDHLQ